MVGSRTRFFLFVIGNQMRELVLAEIATIREGSDNFRGSRWTAISCVYRGGKNVDVQKLNFEDLSDKELLAIFKVILCCCFKQR